MKPTEPHAQGTRTDWTALAVLAGGLAWATWYVLGTRANPYDEPEAAWLITPLLVGLWASAPFVAWSAIGPLKKRLRTDPDTAIGAHPNRIAFVGALPVLAAAIWALGLVITILLWVPGLLLAMGERRWRLHGGLVGLLLLIIWGGFVQGLNVDLPLWPRFL